MALAEWTVLVLFSQRATHGFAVSQLTAPDGELGRIWRIPRPVVYRSIGRLLEAGLITVQRHEQTDRRQIVDGIRLEFASPEARRAYSCDGRITQRRDRDDVEAGGQETRKLHATRFASHGRRPFFRMRRKFK